MAFRGVVWAGVVLVVSACSDVTTDASYEEVDSESQAVESGFDRPAAAALVVRGNGSNEPWVFACDSSNRLQRNIRHGLMWSGWEPIDTTCVSVPSVAKWYNPTTDTDAVAVYARHNDNKLWEIYWPDATNDPDTAYWWNLSNETGFGTITGDVVVAETQDQNGFVSIAVKKASNNELWTFDYLNGWSTRPVLAASGATIVTTNTVSARASITKQWPDPSVLTGRGLTSTNDTSQWRVWRSPESLGSSYDTCCTGFPINGAWETENTSVAFNGSGANYGTRRFNSSNPACSDCLQYRNLSTGTQWSNYQSCKVNGSPRMATHPHVAQWDVGFVRGGNTTSTNDLVIFELIPANPGPVCYSVGGAMYSAPTPFEYPTTAYIKSAVYQSTNARLFFYDGINDSHEHLTNLTLP